MSTETIKQADFTFAVTSPNLTDLPALQDLLAKQVQSEDFAAIVKHLRSEVKHRSADGGAHPMASGKAKGFDLTISGTGGESGGKGSGSVTVGVTIHF